MNALFIRAEILLISVVLSLEFFAPKGTNGHVWSQF